MTNAASAARMWRLSLARRSLRDAERSLSSVDPLSLAEAVSDAQDAAELVVLVAAEMIGIKVGDRDGFATIFDKVSERSKAAKAASLALLTLNKTRIAAKHFGVQPHPVQGPAIVRAGIEATCAIARARPIGVDLYRIGLASWLRNYLVRDPLVRAERCLRKKWTAEVVAAFRHDIADAVHFALRQINAGARDGLAFDPFRPNGRLGGVPREMMTMIEATDRGMRSLHEAIGRVATGLPVQDLDHLRQEFPRLSFAHDGTRYWTDGIQMELDQTDAARLFDLALRLAERADPIRRYVPRSHRCRATVAAEAWTGSGETRRLAGMTVPGELYHLGRFVGDDAVIEIFGVDAQVPRSSISIG